MMKIIKWFFCVLLILVVTTVILVNISSIMFVRNVNKEVEKLLSGIQNTEDEIVTERDLEGLPAPVQKWLKNAGVLGEKKMLTVRLKQKGMFKTKKGQSWMPFEAEQYYTTEKPGFIWYTTMKPSPFIFIKGKDIYYKGKGNMVIKFMSLIKVADESGYEINQGEMVRYLNEIMWFPTAALSDYISWEPINQNSARATIEYKGLRASAVYYFNDNGDLVNFAAQRYGEFNGEFRKERWETPIKSYQEFNGIRIPVSGEGVWKLASGDFTYIKVEIVDIAYNIK